MQEMRVFLKELKEDGWVGAWFTCPVIAEELKKKLDVHEMGELYIGDYELPFSVPEKMPVWLLNMYCREVQEMEGTPIGNELKTIVTKIFGGSFEEFMNWKEEIHFYDAHDPETLARLVLEEWDMEILTSLGKYIDYVAYGRELMDREDFLVTSSGVFH